ncbi:tapasin-related protein-like isoform X1 [Carcharodon carcharias]|uniref:tapasin-related protein-like isoform X1 n=1 Tax=Carcharodon carcharias TaxID=13397 RepID=UPI001B7DE5EE|nr:tapasin-related protein-like isoform X1 [Carcharodon carcharias]
MPHDVHWLLLYLVLLVGVESGLRQAADLVLDCWYIEDRGGLGVMGVAFNHEKALLILRNISISGDEETSAWTDYEVQDKDREHIIFEALVSDVPIPDGDALLHADCEGQEVTCDISMLEGPSERHEGEDKPRTTFSGGLRIAGIGLGVSLVFRTIPVTEEEGGERRINERLNVELSTSGTIPLSVEFILYTHTASLRTTLGRNLLLDCGFVGADPDSVSVEWRVQHKGAGRIIYSLAGGEGVSEREGASIENERVHSEGNVSLHIQDFTMKDEGTYICTIKSNRGQAQQAIVVEVMEPPCAVLKAETLHFEAGVRQDLACEISRYYPLDVSVKWSEESEADDQGPLALPGVSYSSHRRNKDGTYNLSSQVSVTPSLEGTSSVYTCEVTHVALEEPLRVSLRLDAPTGYPIAMPGFIVSSVLFLLTLLYFCRPSQGPSDRTGQRKLS